MPATGKPRANDKEVLLLIRLRRLAAKEAMRQIVKRFATPPHYIPEITLLSDYLLNMVLCIELMLKLASGDWDSHNVEDMYRTAFGEDPPSPSLMRAISAGVRNQKYLYEPSSGLENAIPELEALYDELVVRLSQNYPSFEVSKAVSLPPSFARFIRDNPDRFVSIPCPTVQGPGPPPVDIQNQWREDYRLYVDQVRTQFGRVVDSGRDFTFQTLHLYGVND